MKSETAEIDIVERLRQEISGYTDSEIEKAEKDMREAADYIEQLRTGNRLHLELAEIKEAEIERLRAALKEIVESARLVGDWLHVRIARDALREKE